MLALGLLPLAMAVRAQTADPITFVIPADIGAAADRVGRVAADALATILETRVTVTNVSGFGGVTGTNLIASSPPDGRTLGLGHSVPMIAGPLLSTTAKYNPSEDFVWLAVLGTYPTAMVLSGRRAETSLPQWLAAARAAGTPMSYGTLGVGSAGHLAGSFLRLEQRANLEHRLIQSRDEGYAMLTAGQLDVFFDGVPNAVEVSTSGGNRILAVTSAGRAPALPEVPAFGELWPRESFVVWVGVVAPKGLPDAVYSRLAAAIGVMLLEPRHAQALRASGLMFLGLAGTKAQTYVDDEIVRTAKLMARLSGEGSRRP